MNKIKIPKSFQLFGNTISVKRDKNLIEENDAIGMAKYRKNLIVILENGNNTERPQTHYEITFFHELVHHILNTMNQDELCKDETFLEIFSKLLHQTFRTIGY